MRNDTRCLGVVWEAHCGCLCMRQILHFCAKIAPTKQMQERAHIVIVTTPALPPGGVGQQKKKICWFSSEGSARLAENSNGLYVTRACPPAFRRSLCKLHFQSTFKCPKEFPHPVGVRGWLLQEGLPPCDRCGIN